MTNTSGEQVARLLNLLPYLQARPGVTVAEVARTFGVSEARVVADLKVLWFTGLPGLLPGDLIEIDMDAAEGDGVIHLSNADYLARPLRLTREEALALLVALQSLGAVGGVDDHGAIDRTVAKIEAAVGGGAADALLTEPGADQVAEVAAAVRDALARGRRLHLTYWVPTRDETTERDVDPMRMPVLDGRLYLEGWCHRAESVRLFRLDRVAALRVLDEPAAPPPRAELRDLSAGAYRPSPEDLRVVLEVDPSAAWIAEHYPVESVREGRDGRSVVTLRTADPRWVRRLVLRLGGAARVAEPPELAVSVVEEARAALAALTA